MSFKPWDNYWAFSVATRFGNRYIHNKKVSSFLDAVLATSKEREIMFEAGTILWRAQLGHDSRPIFHYDQDADEIDKEKTKVEVGEDPCPYPPERMKPIFSSATEGRVNPKGIPYLYLADTKETAMSEVRPWPGSSISVGQFKTKKELRLIDCSVSHEKGFVSPHGKYTDEKQKLRVWLEIDKAFSEPVIPSDRTSDYVPTQIITELFKSEGFDGIVYKSSHSTGFNVALFNLGVADLINCYLYEAKSVEFKFKEIANPYFVKEHYEKIDT